MIGIKDVDGFDSIISSCKDNSNDISACVSCMSAGCDSIAEIFNESDMLKVKQNLSSLSNNIKLISKNVSNNIEALEKIKVTYERQDEEVSRSVNDAI